MKTEFQTIAEIFDYGRKLFRHHLDKVPEAHLHTRLKMGDYEVNSAYWIACHCTWAENDLLLQATSGPLPFLPYFDQYSYGTDPAKITEFMPWPEVLQMMDLVHNTAMSWLKSRPDSELDEEVNISETWRTTRRVALYHAIRHESMHTGNLAWILKGVVSP
ncbi:MAG: DinB family protein [Bacteroidia bacterium]|nr:DinB family protein [Bacteroidia bacterium]